MKVFTKKRLRKSFAVFFWIASAGTLISGCGQKNPYADALSLSVTPSQLAFIGPGPVASCVDRDNFKISLAGLTAGDIPVLTYSVEGPVATFNNFELEWKSTDTFYVEEMRINVTGSGLATSPFETTLAPQELEALLAVTGSIINPPADESVTPVTPSPDTIINSNDAVTRASSLLFAPCGLTIGPLLLNAGPKTPPFQAQIQITVLGMAQDSSGNQRFVSVTISTSARYYGS